MNKGRYATRKVRKGRVKIFGKWYYPEDSLREYDGRFDGVKCTFNLYYNADRQLENFVGLWDTKDCHWTWWVAYKQDSP
jgi:hypothetical protein